MRRIVLDISRLISRAAHAVPTGIDRVEMAYAEALLARRPDQLEFCAVHLGRAAILPRDAAQAFVEETSRRWRTAGAEIAPMRTAARRLLGTVLVRSVLPGDRRRDATYLLTSHHHLDRPELIADLRGRCGAFVCFIHDLIPAEYPEYARPLEAERHRRRARTAAALADGVIVNSADTARAFAPYLREAGRAPPVLVAPLGVDPASPAPDTAAADGPPTFLFVGTIEPRKNHLLVLHVWRRLAEQRETAPRLVLVGRRGWENENVIDMIERCTALHGLVEERNHLSDPELRALMARARALLLPTFAEGYGLPLAEALAAGLPALCSDIPVLREVGGAVPEYLDPLDGPGWTTAIRDYAAPDSVRRAAQLARLRHWQAPGWAAHMDAALDLIERPA